MIRRIWTVCLFAAILLLPAACERRTPEETPETPAVLSQYPGFELLRIFPHQADAFTQGLTFDAERQRLFESTGLYGESDVREVDIETGTVRQKAKLPDNRFGEGLMVWSNQLIQLTWKAGEGRILDIDTLNLQETFSYPGEGWGLTHDGRRWYLSDGTASIRVLDPTSRKEVQRIAVTENETPLLHINELEWVDGWLLANVWQTDRLVAIHPKTGSVVKSWNLSPLWQRLPLDARPDVLNGIAFLPETGTLLVTGKWWPRLFEIRLLDFPDS